MSTVTEDKFDIWVRRKKGPDEQLYFSVSRRTARIYVKAFNKEARKKGAVNRVFVVPAGCVNKTGK